MLAWVTAGSVAPGVQAGSGSALSRTWQEAGRPLRSAGWFGAPVEPEPAEGSKPGWPVVTVAVQPAREAPSSRHTAATSTWSVLIFPRFERTTRRRFPKVSTRLAGQARPCSGAARRTKARRSRRSARRKSIIDLGRGSFVFLGGL